MAPLPNRARCKHPLAPLVVLRCISHRVLLPSPLSKSRLSAFLATFSRDEASLIRQHRRSSHSSLVISSSPTHLFILTAIKHHKRQLLHSLSTLLQSRLLPFPRSATIFIDLAICSLFFPEKLRELWIIPIFFLLVTGVSLGVAWLLGNLFRLKPSQRYPRFLSRKQTSHLLTETLQWLLPHS